MPSNETATRSMSLPENKERPMYSQLSEDELTDLDDSVADPSYRPKRREFLDAYSNEEEEVTIEDENLTPAKLKPNKPANPDLWTRNVNMNRRMKGKDYIGSIIENGKSLKVQKPGRQLRPRGCTDFCKKSKQRFCDVFSEDDRLTLFNKFWALNWHQKQCVVVHSVSKKKVAERKVEGNTDGIFRKKQSHLLKHQRDHERSSTSKSYLEPIFVSFEDLYRIYKDHCLSNAGTALCKKAFHSVFDELNLALFRPKKDQCDVCCAFENQNLTKDVYDNHIQRKADARLSKVQDKLVDENDESVKVLTMDLQAVLLSPRLQASAMYYKTKLACHNFTIYDLATKDVTCFFWHEGEGELTANTFASCIFEYVRMMSPKVKTLIIYSDGCTYQNRNTTMSNTLLKCAANNDITIVQKYLEKEQRDRYYELNIPPEEWDRYYVLNIPPEEWDRYNELNISPEQWDRYYELNIPPEQWNRYYELNIPPEQWDSYNELNILPEQWDRYYELNILPEQCDRYYELNITPEQWDRYYELNISPEQWDRYYELNIPPEQWDRYNELNISPEQWDKTSHQNNGIDIMN
ncbi:hypothetical protein LOTGIDRAFT_154553 [Lottia gigantea]|uniref:Uncharacterized protein n=1 Tax=Lottia gigantea TaxID=225164 RepID=V4BE34_LOTGI|nr:hypothetical protein LOTGIDRAFT_154553 [Lottia gigantea]ESO87064.1 hypothetical protein LOTGIDRAFT_154553 [Lottia gigantea]